ncbi:MAG: ectonucleotide pyrophosphatase/phosphodiesterase [Chryseolinea sp.]
MKAAFLFLYLSGVTQLYAQSDNSYVLLVSFDGFRHDYVSAFGAPHFKSLMKEGAYAKALIPCFPSKTFPNHYTLVTGLYPGHHGLVDNAFYDPARKVFYSMKNRERVADPYFYGGKPIWQLAKEHGIKSASYFWAGSEVPLTHPDYYYPYNELVPDTARIAEVLCWLKLPLDQRPHFVALYFSSPDHEGHLYGPSAEETKRAVLHADELLGMLMAGIAKTKLPINLIVVSDHGMKELKKEESTYIFLPELFNVNDTTIKVSNGGTQAHLYLNRKNNTDSLYSFLKAKSENFVVMKKEDFPKRWHYDNPRSGDIIIIANEGFYISDRDRASFVKTLKKNETFGVHGYDPSETKDMWGIFYAKGPNIKKGIVIEPFQNIHVYPLMARILGLPLPPIDGSVDALNLIYNNKRNKGSE